MSEITIDNKLSVGMGSSVEEIADAVAKVVPAAAVIASEVVAAIPAPVTPSAIAAAVAASLPASATPAQVAAAVVSALPHTPTAAEVAAAVAAAIPQQATAFTGEYRLFALAAGQGAPAGWEVDTQREVPAGIYASMPAILPVAKSESTQNLPAAVLGDYLYQATTTAVTKTRLSDGAVVATFTHGQSFNPGSRPMLLALGSYILMVGGATGSGAQSAVYRLNVDTGVFTRLTDMLATRVHTSLVALDDTRFLIVGGNSNPAGEPSPFDTVWLYNTTASTCTLVATLATAASYVRTARLPSGNVFIGGGLNATAGTVNTYQIFNATNNTLSAAKSIPVAYQMGQAREVVSFRTASGVGYLSGGLSVGNCFAEYNETTDSFSAFQGYVPVGYRTITASGATSATEANDMRASSYGHVIPVSYNYPLVLIGSGYAPTYRYCRKL